MADKERDKEGLPDPTSNYSNKIKEKIKEIDLQINTQITIPQYNKHVHKKLAKLPYYYYKENKEHYMSVMEHLSKKYDFDPYIYKELEMNEGYPPGARHIFPHSGGCAQCSHYPVYANPHDPYKANPPILNIRSNQNHLRRWIEFTELDENQVLKEELQEEWDIYKKCFVPFVTHQTVMHKTDARRLVYLMQYEDFVYDDFVGRTPNYVNSNFTYDKPIPNEVDSSFARMLARKKDAIQQRKQQEEQQDKEKTISDAEKNLENEKKQVVKQMELMQEQLKQQEHANKQLQNELKFLRQQGYQKRSHLGDSFAKTISEEDEQQYYDSQGLNNMRKYETKFEGDKEMQPVVTLSYNQGNNVTFSSKPSGSNQKILSSSQIQAGQLQGQSERQISGNNLENKQSSKVRLPPSQTDVEKKYNPNYAPRPSDMEFQLKTLKNKPENQEQYLPLYAQEGGSSRELKLKTIQQPAQQTKEQTSQAYQQQLQDVNSKRQTFSYLATSSYSQFGGGKKLKPSSVLQLKTRNLIKSDEDEYYGHNMSPTHAQQDMLEEDPQIKSFTKFDSKDDREKYILEHNQRASQTQFSQHFDSHPNSQTSLHNIQLQQSNHLSPQKKFSQQIFQQVIVDVQEDGTPLNRNIN